MTVLTKIFPPPREGSRWSCGEDSVAGRRLVAVVPTWIFVHVIILGTTHL